MDDSQQQQQDEERRRQEEDNYACAMIKLDQLSPSRDSRSDTAPDGRNIADWNRAIIGPQQQAIENLNAKARQRK